MKLILFSLLAILLAYIFVPLIQGRPFHRINNKILLISVGAGILSASLILLIKLFIFPDLLRYSLGKDTLSVTLFISFFEAGVLEELAKVLCFALAVYIVRIKLLKYPNKAEDGESKELSKLNTLLIALCVGLGFGLSENILYIHNALGQEQTDWQIIQLVFQRNFTAVIAHMIMTGTFAYCLLRNIKAYWAILIAVFIHGLYDFFALPQTLLGSIFVYLWLTVGLVFLIYGSVVLRELDAGKLSK